MVIKIATDSDIEVKISKYTPLCPLLLRPKSRFFHMGAGKITTNSEMKELHSLADENTTRNTPKVKLTRVVLLGIPLINESSTNRKRRVTDMYEHNTNTVRTKQGSLRDVGK